MVEEPEPLTSNQREELLGLLREWRDTHPAPGEPALATLGRDYSPHQIVDEVAEGTEFGNRLGQFLYRSAGSYGTKPHDMIGLAIEANREGR
jgi:hypothetical protein